MRKILMPSRDECAVVYRYIKKNNGFKYSAEALHNRVSDTSISYGKLCVIITAFKELRLIEASDNFTALEISLVNRPPKVDILSAPIIRKLL